jgi:hypothetical protein
LSKTNLLASLLLLLFTPKGREDLSLASKSTIFFASLPLLLFPQAPSILLFSPQPQANMNQFGGDVALLPDGFTPQTHIHCMRCGKMFMLCQCEGLNHGEDMMYVMDPIPPQFTVLQRIQRWALLWSYHPLLSNLDAVQYVKDRSSTLVSDMEAVQPIIAQQMEQYKNGGGLMEHCKKMFDQARLQSSYEQCCKDCDFAMEHFFKGNWGYSCKLEYTFLNNAVQMSGPGTYSMYEKMVCDIFIVIVLTFIFLCGFVVIAYRGLRCGNGRSFSASL